MNTEMPDLSSLIEEALAVVPCNLPPPSIVVSNFYIGTRIDHVLRKNKFTVAYAAEQIGLPWTDLLQMLVGARQIHLLTLYQIAKLCKVNMNYFFNGLDEYASNPTQRIAEILNQLYPQPGTEELMAQK